MRHDGVTFRAGDTPGDVYVDIPQEPADEPRGPGIQPPPADELIATEDEMARARLAPRCIVRHHTYADVAQTIAPGGTGKTTLILHEAVHIALGRPLWGLSVEAPGWTLVVTAEDRREQILARLREILAAMDLTPGERDIARRGVRVWDVTGTHARLVAAANGNVVMTRMADAIVDAYRDDPPAVVIFDPMVSFGAAEAMVNDNEQGVITAARRIVRGLDCCVRVIHHTGKSNAREATLDQYSGRGGSALADGTRMTTVLQAWTPDGPQRLTPPPGCTPTPGSSITIMARPKLSYAPPGLPLIWVLRTGYHYEHYVSQPPASPGVQRAARADQVERYLAAELSAGRYHTRTTLGARAGDLAMTRRDVREAIDELVMERRVTETPLPRDACHGGRQTYLHPVIYPADGSGGVDPGEGDQDAPTAPPPTTPPPYRDGNPGGVVRRGPHPTSRHPADDVRRGTAGLAGYPDPDDDATVVEVEI